MPPAPCEPIAAWKRLEDVVGSLVLAPIAAVPLLVVAIAIYLEGGRPILMRQRRIGREGREFGMWKFRTLPVNTPQVAKSELEGIASRATRLGRFLRRTSLDELPQLWNVLTGEMSLIGPRPALFNQYDLTAARAASGVLCVSPGMTGLAQVSGREDLSIADKVELDAEYVRGMSLTGDLRIAFRTIGAVLGARGSR